MFTYVMLSYATVQLSNRWRVCLNFVSFSFHFSISLCKHILIFCIQLFLFLYVYNMPCQSPSNNKTSNIYYMRHTVALDCLYPDWLCIICSWYAAAECCSVSNKSSISVQEICMSYTKIYLEHLPCAWLKSSLLHRPDWDIILNSWIKRLAR